MFVPPIVYGTAWKEDATEGLVFGALSLGFRGLDTANQRKHYDEAAVGRGLARALAAGVIASRADVFVQTKFTFLAGQDARLPYDRDAPIATQVEQSFARSCTHLGVAYVDSLVLHGPSQRDGLGPDDREAWAALAAIHARGGARHVGVSNASAAQVEAFVALGGAPVAFVQNRCYASRGWDRDVRAACARHGIAYQGFSLLTANRDVVASREVRAIAARLGKTPAQVVLRFAQALGMIPLTGTASPQHMRDDLALADVALTDADVAIVSALQPAIG